MYVILCYCMLIIIVGWFYNKHGYCQNVEECLYRHIDPVTRVGLCPWYERGFCPLGPECSKRHVKGKRICHMFLTGFCPLGKECPDAQYFPSLFFIC
jgi:cleavage and polyadenylation specificity factor subunit 4